MTVMVRRPTDLFRLAWEFAWALFRNRHRLASLEDVRLNAFGRERIRQVALWYLLVYRGYRLTETSRSMSSDVDRFAMGVVTWARAPHISPFHFVERWT